MLRLRTQLIWAFALVLLIPSIVIGFYAQRTIAESVLQREQVNRRWAANEQAQHVESLLQSDRNDFIFLSRSPLVREYVNASAAKTFDSARLRTFLQQFMKDSRFHVIILTDKDGQVAFSVSSVKDHEASDHKEISAWATSTNSLPPGAVYVSAPTLREGNISNGLVLAYGTPLFDANGRRFGAIIADADIDGILQAAVTATPSEITYVIDGTNGRYLLNPADGLSSRTLYDDAVNDAGIILAQNKKEGILLGSIDRPSMFQSFVRLRPVGFDSIDWVILYNYPLDLLLALATQARNFIILLAVLAGLIALAAATFIATGMTHPIVALSKTAIALSHGNWEAPLPRPPSRFLPRLTEVSHLIESFAIMRTGLLQSRRDLEEYNKRLEATVADRTRELAAKSDEYREAKARLETVIASITDGICVVGDGRLIMMNPSAREMFGLTRGHAIGDSFDDLHLKMERTNGQPFPADGLMLLRGLPNAPAVENGALIIVGTAGRLPVSYRSAAIFSGDKPVGAVIVFRDISAEFESDRAKSEFVSIASHQLRTPLTAIRWYAEAIADGEYGPLAPEMMEAIQTVCVSSRRMSSLIDTLLNVARLESGRLRIAPEAGDLPALLREIAAENLPAITHRKINFKTELAADIPPINFDPDLVKVVLQNLLTNAIKYTLSGGTVTVSITHDGDSVVTAVADTGIGIPEHQHSQIFQKMFRASNVTTTNTEGNGLGLYIAKMVVEQCGGRIWFETKEGAGTTFYFTLPIKGVPYHEGNRSLITKIPEV
jgi:two-component system sensor histidine kinase VicK